MTICLRRFFLILSFSINSVHSLTPSLTHLDANVAGICLVLLVVQPGIELELDRYGDAIRAGVGGFRGLQGAACHGHGELIVGFFLIRVGH